MSESTGNRESIPWKLAVALCVLALVGGVWLGRVAFVSTEEESPYIVQAEVVDTEFEGGAQVQYLDDREIYILSVWSMPPAPEGSVYQVWVQNGDIVVPAGVINPNSSEFAYASYDGRYETMFVTLESAPFGVEEPSGEPILEADLTALDVPND